MKNKTFQKQTSSSRTASMQLAKLLAKKGYRVFSLSDARKIAHDNNIVIKNMYSAILTLSSQRWIHKIKKGYYILDSVLIGGLPVHEFEIATQIVKPSAISYFTAFHIHELTDQIPQIVYVSAPEGTTIPRVPKGHYFIFKGVRYHFLLVSAVHFFGIEPKWRGEAQIPVTDLERTLLDGLAKPKYCGGFMEVLHAFSSRKFDLKKIIEYALRLDTSVAKRLGWVLERIGYKRAQLTKLVALPAKGYILLDASGTKKGPYNRVWKIRENY